jgi:hypothetical protein
MHLSQTELANLEKVARVTGHTDLADKLKQTLLETAGPVAIIPVKPTPGLLNSMCMRYRHDFGILKEADEPMSSGVTEAERKSLQGTMRQLHEEVVGAGFYSVEQESEYVKLGSS